MPASPVLDPELEALLPTAEDIYDALMGKIEPDLVSTNLPLLESAYLGETPAQKQVRMARYQKALAAYDKALDAWCLQMEQRTRKLRTDVAAELEGESRNKDESILAELESAMTTSSPS
jgi:hypothetical protein